MKKQSKARKLSGSLSSVKARNNLKRSGRLKTAAVLSAGIASASLSSLWPSSVLADQTWSGTTNTNFETGTNWVSGNAPAMALTGDVGIFPATVTANQPSLTTSRSILGLSFLPLAGGWVLGGPAFTLTLGGSGISTSSQTSGINVINSNIALGATQTWAGGGFTAAGLTVNGIVSGSSALTINGSGNLSLWGLNTFSGGTTLTSGILNINSATALGTGALTVSGGATINNNSLANITLSTNNALNLSSNLAFTGSSDLNFGTGVVTLAGASRTITVNGGTFTMGGGVTDGGSGYTLTNAGVGTLVLNGAAGNWTGGVIDSAGVLSIGSDTALGTGGLTLSGGTLQSSGTARSISNVTTLTGNATIGGNANFTFNGGVTNSGGSRTLTVNNTGLTTLAGPVYLSEATVTGRTLTIAGSGNTTINGVISNSSGGSGTAGGLTYSGTGVLTLTNANTFSGSVIAGSGSTGTNGASTPNVLVGGGTLKLDFSAAGAPTSNILYNGVTISSQTLTLNGGGLAVQGSNSANVTQTIGNIVLNAGMNTISLTAGSGGNNIGVTVGTIANSNSSQNANSAALLNVTGITATNTVATQSVNNATNILSESGVGGYSLNGTDWATSSTGAVAGGNIVAYSSYTPNGLTSLGTASQNVNVTTQNTAVTGTTGLTANTLRFNDNAARSITLVTGLLDLSNGNSNTGGDILVTNNVGSNNVTISGGTVRGSSNRGYDIYDYDTTGAATGNGLIINSQLTELNNGGNVLAIGGGGLVTLGGANQISGAVYVEGGSTLQVSSDTNLGWSNNNATAGNNQAAPIDAALNLSNATLKVTGSSFALADPSNSKLRAIGLGQQGGTFDTSGLTGVNPTLTVQGMVTGAGNLTKIGAGTLGFSGANNYTGSTIINGGTVTAGSNAAPANEVLTTQGLQTAVTAFSSGASSIVVTNSTGLLAGQLITGSGIPVGDTIKTVSGTTITLNANTTGSNSGSYNIYKNAPTSVSSSFAAGAISISVTSASNIAVGQFITGTGIANGTAVTGISGTTITLSQATTGASDANVDYTFGGVNQALVSSAAGITGGESIAATGVGTSISGVNTTGNIITLSTANTQIATPTTTSIGAWQSLGSGTVTLANTVGVTLDLSSSTGTTTITALNGGGATGGNVILGTSTSVLAIGGTNLNSSFAGAISGSGGLTKSGVANLTLTGVNTYTGATLVSFGKLTLSNGSMGNTAISSPNTATLQINGTYTIGGTVSLGGSSGGILPTLSLQDGTINTLTISATGGTTTSLALGSGSGTTGVTDASLLAFDVGSTSDKIVLSAGRAQFNNGTTLSINGLGNLSGTQQTLTSYANAHTGNTPTLVTTTGNLSGYTLSLTIPTARGEDCF